MVTASLCRAFPWQEAVAALPSHNKPARVGLFRLTPRALAPKALPDHAGMISRSSHLDVLLEVSPLQVRQL